MPASIVINGRAAVRAQISGVERFAGEMAKRLPVLHPDVYRVVTPRPRLAHGLGHAWEQFALPAIAARSRARVIFSPANVGPVLWPRSAVALFDAVLLSHPEWFSATYRATHEPLLRAIARTARRVITLSEFSATELSELAGVPRERIEIVPAGVDERFHPDVDPEPARAALGLDRPYVLTVGGAGLRKNLRALEPVAPLLDREGIDLVAGGVRRAHHPQDSDVKGVRGIGYVPEELLPGLYAGARAFVLPSLHEGYGLPCVEAMRAGVPVAASDRGAVPEACGGAALHFDPEDPGAMAGAVLRAATDDAERARLRELGLARASGLTWAASAEATDRILQRV